MNKEIKNLDILLKIGVLMLLISGIILATTNYEFIPDVLKVIILFVISLLFGGLTFLSAWKLKIKSTTKSYLIASFGFLIFTIIAVGFFKIFGNSLCFTNHSIFILLSIITGLTTIFTIVYDAIFKSGFMKVWGSFNIFAFMIFVLNIFHIDFDIILLITSLIYLISKFLNMEWSYGKLNIILLSFYQYILIFIVCFININHYFDNLMVIACLITFIDTLVLTIMNKNIVVKIFSFMYTYKIGLALILGFCALKKVACYYQLIFILGLFLGGYIFDFIKPGTKYNKLNNIYSIVFTCITIFTGIFTGSLELLAAVCLLLIFNILQSIKKNSEGLFVWRLLNIILVGMCFIAVFNDYFYNVSFITAGSIISLTILVLYFVAIKKNYAWIFMLFSIIVLFFTSIETIFSDINNLLTADGIFALTNIVVLVGYYVYSMIKSCEKTHSIYKTLGNILYIVILVYIFGLMLINNIFNLSIWIAALIVIVWYLIFYFLAFDNKFIKWVTPFMLIIPSIMLFGDININSSLNYMLVTMTIYLEVLLFIFNFKDKTRYVLFLIFTPIVLMFDVFNQTLYPSLFAGIYSFALLMYGIFKENHKGVFVLGIILTVLNIFYSLKNVWRDIPFWLYLLICGLLIIIIVSYRIVKVAGREK